MELQHWPPSYVIQLEDGTVKDTGPDRICQPPTTAQHSPRPARVHHPATTPCAPALHEPAAGSEQVCRTAPDQACSATSRILPAAAATKDPSLCASSPASSSNCKWGCSTALAARGPAAEPGNRGFQARRSQDRRCEKAGQKRRQLIGL
eukprot:jgi/Tetstr1/458970/TSEL_004441.t1